MGEDAKRLLLERLRKKQGHGELSRAKRASLSLSLDALPQHWDVIVLGGGLAGLSLARQLEQRCPEARILVVEKSRHPVGEAAHKVGESTVEIAAHYFGEVLGLKRHLQTRQLKKLGLRFFFRHADNRELHRRLELGPFIAQTLPVPSYQLDRGRFENYLGSELGQAGGVLLDGCRVTAIELGDPQRVTLVSDAEGRERSVTARWVVDASGRRSLLKRKLGLGRSVDHDVNAVWFRFDGEIDPESWTREPRFGERMPPGYRRFSTNHLMGTGYWVWLIPLASGATSVGIVADAKIHDFDELRTFERALHWLELHEPQCFAACTQRRGGLKDFLLLKHYSHGCERVFSNQRWAIVGDAGVFSDPFYSPGSDFIAFANTLTTELIAHDLEGEDIGERVDLYHWLFLDILFPTAMTVFRDHYPTMGNARVMSAKIIWDFAVYWGFMGPLFIHGLLGDLDTLTRLRPSLLRFKQLQTRAQSQLLSWHRDSADQGQVHDDHIDLTKLDFLYRWHCAMRDSLDPDAFVQRMEDNLDQLESLCELIERHALGDPPAEGALAHDLDYLWSRLGTAPPGVGA